MTGTMRQRADLAAHELAAVAHRAGLVAVPAGDVPPGTARELARRIVGGELVAARPSRPPLAPRTVLPALAAATATAVAVASFVALQPAAPAVAGPPRLEFAQEGQSLAPTSGVAPQADLAELAAAADVATVPGPSDVATVQEVVTAGWGSAADDAEGDDQSFVTALTEVRTAPDGSVTVHQERGAPLTEDGRGIDVSVAPTTPSEGTDALPADTLDPVLAAGLPAEPAELRQRLGVLLGCDDPAVRSTAACVVQAVEYVHTFTVVPAEVEAAMWEVLAQEPGIVSLGGVEDRAGRPGVAIAATAEARDGSTTMSVLVADPASGGLLGAEHLSFEPEMRPGQARVLGFVTYLSRDWVADER